MRPVNLIPADQLRSSKVPIRTGPIAYMLIGALALGLGAVTLLVLTNNKIADHKAEISSLKQQEAAATARAQQFSSFSNFSKLEQNRHQTVANLADSRFDWERVMRELSRVMPGNVWLTHLVGTASGGGGGDAASTDSSSTSGPSLQITGCATDQDAVAGFMSSLRDIDGVTRVGLTSSEKSDESAGGAGAASGDSAGSGGGTEDCRTRDFIPQFEIVVAFDNAPQPQGSGATPTTLSATPPGGTTPASTTTTPTTPAPAPADSGAATPAATTP